MHIQKLTASRRSGIGIQQLTFHCDRSLLLTNTFRDKKKQQQQEREFTHFAAEPCLAV
jgi:hypothetical protein